MLIRNQHADYRKPLEAVDAETLGIEAAETVERFLSHRPNHRPTPLRSLPALARELGIGAVHLKDEGFRLGLGSFKALGGAYAVIRLVLEAAEARLGRPVAIAELHSPEVAKISAAMTFGCATDGNHGRSVAQGAQLVGARSVIFVHGGVSDARVAAIARYGAVMERVAGTYDDSVAEAARVCEANGWTVVSDTSWPGYERIPGLVMQGYTAIFREALEKLPEAPTHVFIQAGVGGIAAAAAGYLANRYGEARPTFVVVDPARAACIFETARQGKPVKIAHGEPTVMAMLECYEPSQVAWRVLSRVADAFMTVEDETAVEVMNLLARPFDHDPVVVAGESGGAGLAGLLVAARDAGMRAAIGLDVHSRVLLVITEGATDPDRYRELVGLTPGDIAIAGK
ncbi:diaminopropionate ammonia-lyase [Aminobacter sp. NyZ550]|uniref:diaminopropionate ammonia-lyase n=1 Tax=unclassified Aminobacter TaxID=2644704 RepID=UPI0012AF753D|nr:MULTISPECIES: diaminopropionate ammonia-lyase [unclassified Aminobacter]MRX33032.1 diaminopropionate ammonia-lyase [Aminobacter sp. MDW-2]QNH36667.1 diaminopropionate ammonia-lyase [Aminobacter sp. MDW-2]WAX97470.1 diaminopropionate ammonia-lyase [Aminobacter sp. NyZ550]WMC95524.1 diaminopropionate ammonia-lyase [Aminobacter aminovorans]